MPCWILFPIWRVGNYWSVWKPRLCGNLLQGSQVENNWSLGKPRLCSSSLQDTFKHIHVALILDSCLVRSWRELLHILGFVRMRASMVSERWVSNISGLINSRTIRILGLLIFDGTTSFDIELDKHMQTTHRVSDLHQTWLTNLQTVSFSFFDLRSNLMESFTLCSSFT